MPADEVNSADYGKTAGFLAVGVGLTGVMTYGFFLVASHTLSTTDYGQITVLWSAVFITISSLCCPIEQLLSRQVSERTARGEPVDQTIRVAATIQFGVSLIFAVVALALRHLLQDDLLSGNESLYWVYFSAVIFYAVSYFARGYLAGSQRFGMFVGLILSESCFRTLFAVLVAVGLLSGQSAVAIGIVAAPVLGLIIVPTIFFRRAREVRATPPPAPADGEDHEHSSPPHPPAHERRPGFRRSIRPHGAPGAARRRPLHRAGRRRRPDRRAEMHADRLRQEIHLRPRRPADGHLRDGPLSGLGDAQPGLRRPGPGAAGGRSLDHLRGGLHRLELPADRRQRAAADRDRLHARRRRPLCPALEPGARRGCATARSAPHCGSWRLRPDPRRRSRSAGGRGSRGGLRSRFLALRVRPANVGLRSRASREGAELPPRWALCEWPEGEAEPVKYWLSNLSEDTPIERLVGLAKLRWRIEHDYRELKDALGLDHFEGRTYRAGTTT